MTSLRVGVIGVNGIGQAHLWALRQVEGAELAAVCDIDETRAAKAANDHSVTAFISPDELFASDTVDAVIVATPPGTHGALVRAAIDAGMHVYCEKPFTPTCDEGYALAEHARAAGRVLQVGFQFRFHAGYAALRAAVAEIAPVRRVHVAATNWFRAQQYFHASPWRATWRMAGGGVLMAQAVHQLDALIAAVGMPARVEGRVGVGCHDAEVEDVASAELVWPNGARGVLIASLCEPAGTERFEIVGERGTAVLTDGYDVRVAVHEPIGRLVADLAEEFPSEPIALGAREVPRAPSEWFDMMVASHREFVAARREQRPSLVDGVEGTRSVELANAIYLSSFTERPVDLPLAKGAYPPVFEELAAGRNLARLGG